MSHPCSPWQICGSMVAMLPQNIWKNCTVRTFFWKIMLLTCFFSFPLRSAEQIQNIFGLRVKLLQNKFKISVMGIFVYFIQACNCNCNLKFNLQMVCQSTQVRMNIHDGVFMMRRYWPPIIFFESHRKLIWYDTIKLWSWTS